MASQININGSDDPSYRYKMPKIVGKVEGRGNGIKTVLVNASDVAQALHRPTSQFTKFFGCELGAQSRYQEAEDRAIVNGAFETSDLQQLVFKYIEKFVLCGSCGNPETVQDVKGKKKSAMVYLDCKACGEVGEADNAHKLIVTIIKEQADKGEGTSKKKGSKRKGKKDGEENDSVGSGEKKKKDKKDKKEKKSKKDKKEKKEKKEKKSKKSKKEAAAAEAEASDSENSIDDVAEGVGALSMHDAAAIEDCVDKIRAKVAAASPPLSNADLVQEVETYRVNCGLRKLDSIAMLFFSAVADVPPAAVPTYMDALSDLAQSGREQLEVLSCLEESVTRASFEEAREKTALKMVPLILKALYDEGVVEEKIILGWHKGQLKPEHVRVAVDENTTELVKENAKVIVEWLETAEDGDDDDEDDEGEEEDEEDDEEDGVTNIFGAAPQDEDDSETDEDSD